MAVTMRTYDISANWNSDDILSTLQTALSDVGFHAAAQTGTILTFTSGGGGTIVGAKGKRYLVAQNSTSGSGLYCTFDIFRHASTGAISAVTLVNGGKNYAGTNTITILGTSIGGATPADDLTITVSTVSGSQGSASTWYDVDAASPPTWGVACVNMDETKKMGQTFYSFYIPSVTTALTTNITLYMKAGTGFQPSTNVFNGVLGLDYGIGSAPQTAANANFSQVIAKSNANPLRLITYQSGIDTKFVVFQFADVQIYGDLYRSPFILSNYNSGTQPWSLDDCFTGGIYEIGKNVNFNTSDSAIYSLTYTSAMGKRQGEFGYGGAQGTAVSRYSIGYYESVHGKRFNTLGAVSSNPSIYQRTVMDLAHSSLEYNPVITGLPINNTFIPVPYFMPADFGVTEVIGTNTIAYNDLVSVGATTKWKVLQYANNMLALTYNSAIAFVTKTVD